MTDKVACKECGALILATTTQTNGAAGFGGLSYENKLYFAVGLLEAEVFNAGSTSIFTIAQPTTLPTPLGG